MKKILITGGSDGIGLETARLLAAEGNCLMLVARNRDKLETAVHGLQGKGHSYISADLSSKEGMDAIAAHISVHHYDVMINCAGVGMYGRFEAMPVDELISMMHLNIDCLTILSHRYIQGAKKGDSLVNIASTLGVTSFPGLAAYAATKAFVASFSDSLWWENEGRGIYVLGFCPGATATSFHETAGEHKEIFPKFVLQDPRIVAKELVNALHGRRKPRAVSGSVNRLMLFFQRFMSRKMTVNMMGTFSPVKK
jgi:short-subunit dehydrogenase